MAELYKSVTELMKTARGNKALQGNLGDITDFQQIIDDTPTADVVEVKDARWKGEGMGGYYCSLCQEIVSGNEFKYCPYCGARMDGERE